MKRIYRITTGLKNEKGEVDVKITYKNGKEQVIKDMKIFFTSSLGIVLRNDAALNESQGCIKNLIKRIFNIG